jgi:hypothetical protein
VSAVTFAGLIRKAKSPREGVRVFAASIANINKALELKKVINIEALLLEQYKSYRELFSPKKAAKLPPHRGPEVDHRIKLESKDSQSP